MKKLYPSLVLLFGMLFCGGSSFGQMVGTQIYLPGHFLEIGQNNYGAFGATPPPASYYPYPAGSYLAEVYDYGHDGWTTGAPATMGDYTYPGSPFEGWGIQINGTGGLNWAFTSSGGITGTGTLTGNNLSYVNAGGKLVGNWTGTAAGGQLRINMETRVDTNASWVVVTAKLYNTGATSLNNIYYMRSCDPDNDEAHGGSFFTYNQVTFQTDADQRVGVQAYGEFYTYAYLQMCTKDCRAKALVYSDWPIDFYVTDLSTVYTGTTTIFPNYTVGSADDGDIAIGLVYSLGNLCAGDSTFVSYAYTFLNTKWGIDSAFPEPSITVNGVPVIPPPAPAAIYDTFNACLYPGLTTLPVDLTSATSGVWTWSKWTWSPGVGLATTTGVVNSININSLPPSITYTITGTPFSSCGGTPSTCGSRVIYLTVKTCNGATVNSPCLGDSLIFNAPGDSTGATYVWVGPNSWTTTVSTTQSFTITPSVWGDTGTYHVIKTVGGTHDTATAVVVIHPTPIISGPTNVCAGSTITLVSSVPGVTWTSTNTGIATITAAGVVTGVSAGVVVIDATSTYGCLGTYTVTVNPVAPITGTAVVCMGLTTQLSNTVAGGTWVSTSGAATISATGLVTGVAGGTTTISYTTPAGCLSTIIVTVNPVAPITGTTIVCAGGTTTLADAVPGGTWSSSNTGVGTVGLTTGVVAGIAPGSTIITYTTPAGCISTTTVNVIVLTAITGTMVVCQGSTTTLADGGGGGIWTSANPAVATIGSSSGVVTGISGGTANITYTGGAGCYTSAVVTVNPISPIIGVMSMCQYFSTTLTDALPGGTWSTNTAGSYIVSVNSTTGVITGLTAGTATITYTLPTGCTMTTVVTVHPKPAPPVPHPDTYCQYFISPNPVSVTSGTNLTWYGPGVTGAMSVAPTPSTLVPGNIDYYVTQASAFGCVSDSAHDVVTIIPQPVPPVTRDTMYCQNSPTAYLNYQVVDSNSNSGSHLNWYAPSGIPLGDVAPQPSSGTVTYPLGTSWYVTQTVNGCESNPDTVNVNIVYQPAFTIIASKTWVCDHDTLSFAYSSTTPLTQGSFQWTLPPGATIVSGSATDSAISVRFDSVYGAHVVSLTVGELNYMCWTTNSLNITVIALPTSHCHMNPNICLGDTVSLSLSDRSNTAEVFSWLIDGIALGSSTEVNIIAANSNSGGPFSISWNDTGTHVITLSCTTHEGCRSDPTFDTVDVHNYPDPGFTFKPKSTGTLCLEDSVLFIANDSECYNCSYLWLPEHSFKNDNTPKIWGKVEYTKSDITLTVTDPFGCKASSTTEIDPNSCCTVLFPNAFSPNGDGRNDHFHPLFNGYHRFHQFRIVNRWGQTVFESANSNPEWDGTFGGVPCDLGVYYYYLKYDCGGSTIEVKGDCTLVR